MHDFKSLQLDDEDSSIYFINYISEDSDSPESHQDNDSNDSHSPEDNLETDLSSIPNSLIITPVPQTLFTNQQLKVNVKCFYSSIWPFSFSRSEWIRTIISSLWSGYHRALFKILSTCSNYFHHIVASFKSSIKSSRIFLSWHDH